LGVDQPLAELRSSTTSYYEQDGLGSVTSLSSSSPALANSYTYDVFGKQMASTGTIINPFQYTGRDYDPETGLRYYRARYYSPTFGRFALEMYGARSGSSCAWFVEVSPSVAQPCPLLRARLVVPETSFEEFGRVGTMKSALRNESALSTSGQPIFRLS
jgi:RHS repeat-associated protein